jgi:putative transposase
VGEICLKYLDESGFNLWANVTYSWSRRGEQKRIEQTKKKGKRLNICGLLEIGKRFEYGLALKNFKSESYIKLMDWQADKAEKRLKEKRQITVIVEDQGPIHVSRATREQYKRWEKQGLYIFLLPTYSPELNRIENEWQRIKEDELAGAMFEDEYDLAMTVIELTIDAHDGRGRLLTMKGQNFHPANLKVVENNLTKQDVSTFEKIQSGLDCLQQIRQFKDNVETILLKYNKQNRLNPFYGTIEGEKYRIERNEQTLRVTAKDGRGEIFSCPGDLGCFQP